MKTFSYYAALIIFVSHLSLACSISSSQFENFLQPDAQPKMQDYYWDISYDNLNYRVIAIQMPNGTLFADKFGNSLFFDGWSIDSIVGFGDFEGEYDIYGDEIGTAELNDENSFAVIKNCDDWTLRSKNVQIFEQSCGLNNKFMNKIFVNENEEVIQINQYIEPFNKLMVIKKLSSNN